jgi:hypothetical protein
MSCILEAESLKALCEAVREASIGLVATTRLIAAAAVRAIGVVQPIAMHRDVAYGMPFASSTEMCLFL